MTGHRLSADSAPNSLVDRAKPLEFSFYGKPYAGLQGDTLASALLASGVRIVGRSFKYHRPRGVWGAWFDDPNAIFNVQLGQVELPNCAGATTPLVDGMQVKAVNAWPSAQHDVKGGLDLIHRWLPAGFYYKTFMWPNWHLFEPSIRRMAGLGAVGPSVIDNYMTDQLHEHCDLLVVGGGAAGLVAARAAAEAGENVVLVEDHSALGGGLYRRGRDIDGMKPSAWVTQQQLAITTAGGRILTSTTAYGVYDHGLVALMEYRGFAKAPRLWRLRAGKTLLASGAIDRPVTFANNDLPGILSVEAATEFAGRYGVLVGRSVVIASNNSFADASAAMLEQHGASVRRVNLADGAIRAMGRRGFESVEQGSRKIDGNVLLASAGLTPMLHLWSHAGGKLDWSAERSAFLPGKSPENMAAIGAANGTFDFDQSLDEAEAVALKKPWVPATDRYSVAPHIPVPASPGRQWIDFQHDVTLKDVELAARENFVSVEHLKRYTTLGMAVDQGKTSNVPGLSAMAAILGKSIPDVGTTNFRPPFVPVPLEIYRGHHRGQLHSPLKRLGLELQHREAGAAMGEYGGWLRPGWYGAKSLVQAIEDEVTIARDAVAVLDASPLGKIEVMGPDAEAFINFMYYNTLNTLKPGHIRYGFMLTEGGVVYDDGVVSRFGPDRFVVSCSSSHVEGVLLNLEGWRQDGNDPDRVFVHDTTAHWSTVSITGPRAREVLATLNLPIELSADAFPHMTVRETTWQDTPLRIARVSFTGDISYELSIAARRAPALWAKVMSAARTMGGGPLGIEALSVLRAEKGYIIIGKDTDGETMPHDLGFAGPRLKKQSPFVGDRGLHTDKANDDNRQMLIGLTVPEGNSPLPTGAHIVTAGENPRSLGYITSSYQSPTLGRPIALALMQSGNEQAGQTVNIWHLGQSLTATVSPACAYDPEGVKLHA